MTTKTGITKQTLAGTASPPSIYEALFGAVLQLTLVSWVWVTQTSFGHCLIDPTACLNDPWARQVVFTLGLCTLMWLVSLRTIPSKGTSDPSIVDRLWSIVPWLYCWHFYLSAPSPRLLLMAVLSTVWGVRLTANFAVKGGFSGGEDYRWAEIRSWPGFDKGFELFNLLFICFFQQLVILSFVSPAAVVLSVSEPAPLNGLDASASLLYLLLVLAEAVADQQQLTFQTEKYRRINAKLPLGEYSNGFIESGLWAFSRHPNYFCEVSIWWVFYLFGIAAGAPLLNWSFVGPIFLTCLFALPHASADVTETLSSRKYANFPSYQRRVSKLIPLPPRPEGVRPAMSLLDRLLIGWFAIGLVITFLIDIEQVLVADPLKYVPGARASPVWPPAPCVAAVHWWGALADKLVIARPLWFQVAIWLEVVVQAPFYALAILAFVRAQNWIRVPALVYSSVLLTIMPIVLAEQLYGEHATEKPLLVLGVYSAYVVMPIVVAWRVRNPAVFPPRVVADTKATAGGATKRRAASPSRPKRA
jgi:steroid 5-alpha reductase family enzyme